MKFGFRFLIPVVGFTALSAATLAANMGDMVSVSGHARTRLELSDNAVNGTDTQYQHMILNRVRLNLDISPAKPLMVRITPEFTNTYGDAAPGTDAGIGAHEAWMSWMANDMFTIYMGRQVLDYGKGRIIGKNDWTQVGNNFDAIRASISHGYGRSDLAWGKLARSAVATSQTLRADNNIAYLYNAFTPSGLAFLKALDLYFMWDDDPNGSFGAGNQNFFVIGTRLAGDAGMLNYDIELATEFGKIAGVKDQKGVMMDAQVSAKVMDRANVGLGMGYANTEWVEGFPSDHDQLGKADVINDRQNLIPINVSIDGKINDKWAAGVQGYYFIAAKDDAGLGASNGTIVTQGNNGRNIAIEGDLWLTYQAEKMLGFEFGYDMFKGMSALKSATSGDKLISKLYAQANLTF